MDPETSTAESLPSFIGPYRVIRLLGRGGMAAVYEVESQRTGQHLALKQLTRRGLSISKFNQEYRALVQLDHPNIVRVMDVGQASDGMPYITMELLAGRSVQSHVKAMGRPGEEARTREVIRVLRRIARALNYLHTRRFLHRDIKSSNVMVLKDGRVKLLDLGTARLEQPSHLQHGPGEFVGTFAYASPEQIRGEPLDHRSDLYAFGVLAYRMSTGRQPFQADSSQEAARLHLSWYPPPPDEVIPSLPSALSTLVMSLLERDPEDRPSDAAQVLERLEEIRPGRLDQPATSDVAVPPARPCRREVERLLARILSARSGDLVGVLVGLGDGHFRVVEEADLELQARGWRTCLAEDDGESVLGPLGTLIGDLARSSFPEGEGGRRKAFADPGRDVLLSSLADLDLPSTCEAWVAAATRHVATWLAAGGGKRRQGLLFLPGLHLLDSRVLLLLQDLLRAISASALPVVVLCTMDALLVAEEPALEALLSRGGHHRLPPSDEAEIERLVTALLFHQPPPQGFVAEVIGEVGCRPDFVEAVVLESIQRGILAVHHTPSDGIVWRRDGSGALPLPLAVQEPLLGILAVLGEDGRRVMEMLSVAGGESEVQELAAALGLGDPALRAVLASLAHLGLVRCGWVHGGPGREEREVWSVNLGAVKGMILERMPPVRRQRAIQAWSQVGGPSGGGGWTALCLLEMGRIPEALESVALRCRCLLDRGRHRDVLRFLERFLSHLDNLEGLPAESTTRVVLAWARALFLGGGRDEEADSAFAWVLHHGPSSGRLRWECRLAWAELKMERGQADEARPLLEESYRYLVDLGETDLAVRAALDLGNLALRQGVSDPMVWLETALALVWAAGGRRAGSCPAVGSDGALSGEVGPVGQGTLAALARCQRALCRLTLGAVRYAEAELREIGILALRTEVPSLLAAMGELAGPCLRLQGRFSEACAFLEDLLPALRRSQDHDALARVLLELAEVDVALFRLGLARGRIEEVEALLGEGHPGLALRAAFIQSWIGVLVREDQSALDVSGPALQTARHRGFEHEEALLGAVHALALLRLGRRDEGEDLASRSLRTLERRGELPALAVATQCLAQDLEGRGPVAGVFPVLERWMQREPLDLVRLWWLQAQVATDAETAPEKAGCQALNDHVQRMLERLEPQHRVTFQMNPWVRGNGSGRG